MAKLQRKNGATSVVLRVKIYDSSVTTGAGKTGLTSATSGLVIGTIADNEAAATAYTAAGSTVETIATLGTYAAPTATKCRFKEVDATNHPGVYEIQIADARFAVAGAKSLLITISGPTNAAQCDAEVELTAVDNQDAVRYGLTAMPNAAANANGGLPVLSSSGTTLGYTVSTLTTYTGNTVQTGDAYAQLTAAAAEPTSLPAANASVLTKLNWLFTLARNKVVTDANGIAVRNDGNTADIGTATHSESAGTYTRNKWS